MRRLFLLAALFLIARPVSALTFGELYHHMVFSDYSEEFVGPFDDEVRTRAGGDYRIEASVAVPSPDRLEVSYTVTNNYYTSPSRAEFHSARIPLTFEPGEPLRIRGTTYLDVENLGVSGYARWILVDNSINTGVWGHSAPNGADSFDLSVSVPPGDWSLIYEGSTAYTGGQIVSADFLVFTPEPSTAFLLATGLAGLAAVGRGRW